MPGLEATGNVRKLDDTDFSPRKETKKLRGIPETEAENALKERSTKIRAAHTLCYISND